LELEKHADKSHNPPILKREHGKKRKKRKRRNERRERKKEAISSTKHVVCTWVAVRCL